MKRFVNIITTFRLIYTLFLPALKMKISRMAFIINIICLFLTDTIDGFLARKCKVQTLYGALMDTIADKALCIVLLILLAEKIDMIGILIILEIIIATINTTAMIRRKKTKSTMTGKIKMCVLSATIALNYLYCFNLVGKTIAATSIAITILTQIITVINYIKFTLNSPKMEQKTIFEVRNLQDLKYVLFDTEYYLSSL